MSKEARHHHYLSQCYLRGFTKSGGKKSKLSVIDLKNKKHFETNTRNVGGVRDFNRIEIEGVAPDAIEQNLSVFEGKVATSIRNIEKTKIFEGEDKENILNLIALLEVRSPEMRENLRQFSEKAIKRMTGLTLATKERWESQNQHIDDNDKSEITYEELKKFHGSDAYSVTLTNEHHIDMELTAIDVVLPRLFKRKWVLIIATEISGPFITTDNPVVLTWKNPNDIPPFYRNSPGHGMKNTEILFPISRNLCLFGEFDGKEGMFLGNKELIASLNTKMIMHVYKQVYAPKMNFKFYRNSFEIVEGSKLLSLLNA